MAQALAQKEQSKYIAPNPIAKYMYWSCASVSSVIAIANCRNFLKHNMVDPYRSTLAFKLCAGWLGIRCLLGCIQLPLHSVLNIARIWKSTSADPASVAKIALKKRPW